jgi:DNA-directed RNA polymerase subunit A'
MGFPADFVLTDFMCDSIPCIPPCARPQNYHDGNVRIDQISFALHDIVAKINQYNANENKSSTGPSSQQELLRAITWNIYGHVVDNSDESYKRGTEPIISVKERITGKKGEIRGNSMGKRVQFVERTVLGPDSTLRFGQIGVPELTKTELTVPITVTKHNLTKMQQLLNEHKVKVLIPGPGRGTKGKGFKFEGSKVLITDKNRNLFKYLVPGDIISRHGQDGDRCLFGRQPTLHKEGLQGHSKVYGPAKTLRVHMCNTTAYNADFDGDEGTEHTPQTTGAIVENAYLVNSESCIGDGQKSKVMAGLTYNHLSSLYLATQNGQMKKVLDAEGRNLASGKFDLTREEFARVRASLTADEVILSEEEKEEVSDILTQRQDFPTLPNRLRSHGVNPLSGRGLFSHVLPADFNYDGESIILEFKVEGQTEKVDLSVRIRDGVLISGTLTKSHVGGVHNSIVQYLWKNYGKRRTADFLTDGTFFADWFIYNYGFSIGYEDCKAPDQEAVRRTVDDELYNAQLSIDSLGPEKPGMSREEKSYREQQTRDFTNNAANIGKKIAREQLSYSNPLNIMDSSGAKGNPVNTAQICGIVGQQYVRRERPDPQLDGKRRCLHFFAPNSRKLEARGMVRQSFLEGMNPAGTIFHMIATRVGLVGTAVLTASTGTLHHRLSKVLESTAVQNDGSIRNCTGAIFQLTCFDGFGAEQLIPTKLKKETVYSFIDISATVKSLNQNIQNRLKELDYKPPEKARR